MDRFESFDGSDAHGRLLAVGEMTDTTNMGNIHGQPLLAMAAGKSGEVLRLARIKDSQWQWDGDGSAVLNLSVIDTLIREDETMWPGDGLPITNIKFATAYWQHGSVRWLLVQRHTSVAILQPEYQLMALSRNDANSKWASHPPSYIAPNHLITLHHHQTGGNALSDVCFNAPSQGSSPQIVVIDECGYWSVWDLQGTRQVGKMTLRLVLYKCGHILEGIPDQVTPGSYFPAQKHGILQIGQPDQHEPRYVTSKRAESIKRTLGRSQHVLVWNPECVSLIDLEADSVLPKIDILSQTATKPDWILDIQRSPVDDGLVFVLTARQVIWLDLFPPGIEPGTTSRPRILFTCSHIGLGNENAKMSLCRASEEESDGTMVLIHSPSSDQLAAYWFSFAPDSQLPQWHRHITSLPGDGNNPLPNKVSSIRVQHAKVDVSIGKGESGPWTRYSRAKTKFYQVTILSEDLGVRYCIYASSTDPSLELGLPTSRVGWSKSEDRRRWRLRRRHFVRHMGETFVLPDSIPDEHWDSLIKEQRRRNDEEEISDGDDDDDDDDDNSSEVATAKVRPVFMKFGSIAQTIVSHLQAVVAEGENGLPTQLVDAVRSAIENGVAENSLPLTSW
jgi:RNA polymerase I-specific transcription initiation factor RRN6